MARLLTFRFDDGFMAGALKSAKILAPYAASYFIVGNRVLGLADLEGNPKLKGRDFGSVDAWREMAAQGHDVQPHSYTHRWFSSLPPQEAEEDVRQSVEVVRRIHNGPLIFAFPFNDMIEGLPWAELGVSAAGFATRSSAHPVLYNDIATFDRFQIRSWAIREAHFDAVADGLRSVPDDTWTVLGLHSLDDEGAEPWSSAGFERLVALVIALGFSIETASEAIQQIAPQRGWPL